MNEPKGAPGNAFAKDGLVVHLATGGRTRLCHIAFGIPKPLPPEQFMRAVKDPPWGTLRRVEFDQEAYRKATRRADGHWCCHYGHHITCMNCRVVADWAFEHAVKTTHRWLRFRKEVAKRFAAESNGTIRATKRDGRWGITTMVISGISLSVKLAQAGHPFRLKEAV